MRVGHRAADALPRGAGRSVELRPRNYLPVVDPGTYFIGCVDIPDFIICGGCEYADTQSEKKSYPKAHGIA